MNCENQSPFIPTLTEAELTDGKHCVVDFAKELMDIARMESCGKCVLCREGSWQAYEIIRDITEGKGKSDDLELLREILEINRQYSGCEMSKNAASRCLGLLNTYQEEWDLHVRRKKCSNLICKLSFTLYISPDKCSGCEKCIRTCHVSAISGSEGMIHILDSEICDKCMKCIASCPRNAIKKAGAIKPKVPAELVPVGSFCSGGEGINMGTSMRRRRRSE